MHSQAGIPITGAGEVSERLCDLEQEVLELHKKVQWLESQLREVARQQGPPPIRRPLNIPPPRRS